jgi:hypothetical protein
MNIEIGSKYVVVNPSFNGRKIGEIYKVIGFRRYKDGSIIEVVYIGTGSCSYKTSCGCDIPDFKKMFREIEEEEVI